MRLPSKRVLISLDAPAFEIVSWVEAPRIVGGVELASCLFENFKPEPFHIAYQDDRPQLCVLLSCLFDPGIPNLQDLLAGFLDVGKRVIVSEREDRRGPRGN